jgi:tetratricopeptide (TPR) repeat protein
VKNLLLLIVICLCSQLSYGQIFKDLQLANKYSKDGECEKAITIYKKLDKGSDQLRSFYKYYFDCLIKQEKYNDAILLARKMQKKSSSSTIYLCDIGIVHKTKGNDALASKVFNKCLQKLDKAKVNDIYTLARKWYNIGEYELAIKTYIKGQQIFPNHEFGFQLASAYRQTGKTEKMIDTYIDLIVKKSSNKRNIQITLQNTLGRTKTSDSYKMLKDKLLMSIQKNSNIDLMEMLVWLLIESENYELAFIYTKAIDKQTEGDGSEVYNLGQLAHENSQYNAAIKCYQYLISKSSKFTKNAKILKLIATSEQTLEGEYSTIDLQNLKSKYQELFVELGENESTSYLMKQYADLNAYYLNDLELSKITLNKCIKATTKGETQAQCKLMLADLYVIEDREWDAILTYSQIDNEYKQSPLGSEAKFRRARISYYQGDFEWAQAQLDVLKASTSKLIANNAMQLSLLITDNLGLDTSEAAMQLYSRSELLEQQNKWQECHTLLDSLSNTYKSHTLIDEVIFKKAKIYEKQKKYEDASIQYEKVAQDYSFDILADDALYMRAILLEEKLQNKKLAQELYEKILLDHPDSIYTVDARKRYRELREE